MKSSLSSKVARQNMNADEIEHWAGVAWRTRGYAMFQIDAIMDEWFKQAISNHCNKLYGEREGK